jgi:hypothetical protein
MTDPEVRHGKLADTAATERFEQSGRSVCF